MTLSNETKLSLVGTFELMDLAGQDYACSLVAQDRGKRVREVTDEDVMEYHKELIKAVFSEKCNADIENGFDSTVNGHRYRTNRDDQINFIGEYLLLQSDASIQGAVWTTEDVGPLPLTRDEFFQVYKEAFTHKNDTIKRYWVKKNEVDACTTHAELRNITWENPIAEPTPVGDTDDSSNIGIDPVEPAPEEQPIAQALEVEEPKKKKWLGLI